MTRRTRSKRQKIEWWSLSFPHISLLSLSWTLAVSPSPTYLHLAHTPSLASHPHSILLPPLSSCLPTSKPNSHPSLSHLLPPTPSLSGLFPVYLPTSFAFFLSFSFLFISLSQIFSPFSFVAERRPAAACCRRCGGSSCCSCPVWSSGSGPAASRGPAGSGCP
jgi:hypothetical protein